LSGLSAALLKALTRFSLAMAEARSCPSGRLASKARASARPVSTRRRVVPAVRRPRLVRAGRGLQEGRLAGLPSSRPLAAWPEAAVAA